MPQAAAKALGIELYAVGFGGVLESSLHAIASSPASLYAFRGESVSEITARFATFYRIWQGMPKASRDQLKLKP